MSNRKLFKIAGFVGIITILSKVLGLIRDLVIAHVFGTSITADAYNFAYLLTGNFLILLGGLGGPFHSSTVALLTKIKDDAKESFSFLIKIFSSTFFVFTLITIVALYFKEEIVHFIIPASGLEKSYQERLWQETITQFEIMSPLIIISGLLGISCGVANVYKGYFWPSFGPALPSISIILAVLFYKNPNAGIALAIGTLIGACLEFVVQVPYLLKAYFYENLKPALIKNQKIIKDYYFFLGPALLSTTIGQITVYIDGFFCSGLEEGSWTATVFANRLIQLPLGVLLTAFLVPFFPRFSELANEKNIEKLKETAILVIKSLWFITLPIAAFLYMQAKPIIEVVFKRGAFDDRSVNLVSGILIALLLSMVAYVARDTLTRVFYSLGNSKIPFLVALISIVLKIILNMVLVEKYHAAGIAFSTSIVTLVNFLILGFLLRTKIGCLGWGKHIFSLFKMCFATVLMFVVSTFLAKLFLNEFIPIFKLILLFFISFGIYFASSLMLKVSEAKKILEELKLLSFPKTS